MKRKVNKDFASFRDPAGFIFYENNKIYRQINKVYFKEYNHLIKSGLYSELISDNYLITHTEKEKNRDRIILEVEKIPFISYPYEWSFSALQNAALLTIKINQIALKYGMILKDASAFNIQFKNSKPILIDTLSFSFYKDGDPWFGYGQFTRHFIAPLLLMKYVDGHLNSLLRNYIDGIPVDIANNILKKRGGLVAKQHIKWQAKMIAKHNNDALKKQNNKINLGKNYVKNILGMLYRQIISLNIDKYNTEWETYYEHTNYSDVSQKEKIKLIEKYISKINLNNDDLVYDFGANDGYYSHLIKKGNIICFDVDMGATNKNYEQSYQNNENILPLICDFTNPTPALGFALEERKTIEQRGQAKIILALALIHHLAISNNLPFNKIANWLEKFGKYLIIEFIPKEDSQVQILLTTREDIFPDYNQENFEKEFTQYYNIIEKHTINGSQRSIYLMERKDAK